MFRPCIDLHQGRVKQLVGGTYSDSGQGLQENFVAEHPASWFADLYRRDGLAGGHMILLGAGNEPAAREALAAYPGGLQVGGGVTAENALPWLEAGASQVIVTSWLFDAHGELSLERLERLSRLVGRERLVVDLSCRRRADDYYVVIERWQKFTRLRVDEATLAALAGYCAEFLVHGVDVEGRRLGVDRELVDRLSRWAPIETTYAGGATSLADLEEVTRIGHGRIHLTIGSALDIFGGTVPYAEAVAFNRRQRV